MEILHTNDIGTFFNQTLLKHIKHGKEDGVSTFLENLDPCRLSSSVGTTLLHFAAKYGNKDFAQHLINLGAEVDAQNRYKETPLMYAVDENQIDTVQLLLEANADVFLPDNSGQGALSKAFKNRRTINPEIIAALLNKVTVESLSSSVYVNSQKFHSECPLYNFIPIRKSEITRILIEKGSPIDAPIPGTNETSLHVAVKLLDLENVKLLLNFNADVNAKSFDLKFSVFTPLACVPVKGYKDQSIALKIVKALIAAGAVLINNESRFMVWSLLKHGNREIVRTVLQSGLDLQQHGSFGRTALHILAENRHPDVFKEVQDKELARSIRIKDENGDTLLHVASIACNWKNSKYLLDHGADVNARNILGYTPLYWSVNRIMFGKQLNEQHEGTFHDDCLQNIEMLLEHGAYPVISREFEEEEEEEFNPRGIRLVEPVIAHIALNESFGQGIDGLLQNQIERSQVYKPILDLKKQEIIEMKNVKITKSVSLYDFFITSDQMISLYARNPRFVTNLNELMHLYTLDTYYHRRLRKRFLRFNELVEMRKKIATAINKSFKNVYEVSIYIVAERIVNYLDDEELDRILPIFS